MFTLRGLRKDFSGVTMLTAVLNILSELVLVAQMHMYFCANLANRGNLLWLSRHHIKGSDDASSASSWRNLVSSTSACTLFGTNA